MEFFIKESRRSYTIKNPEQLTTPRLLVFRDRVEFNIRKMRELLAAVNPQLGLECLCPHVKTHKSSWATRLLMQHGVSFFKASLNEVDMLAACGAPKIFVSYPLLEKDAQRMARLAATHTDIQFYVQVARPEHVRFLKNSSREFDLKWHYFIDVNVGMDRTGLPVEDAFDFYQSNNDPSFLEFVGLHAYDGHIHQRKADDRRRAAQESLPGLLKSLKLFKSHGVKVPMTMVGGTPSFLADVELLHALDAETRIFYSPGTWIYFDSVSMEMMPDTFDYAALLLAQVIDRPTGDTATLNLGHKRWAVDQGPIERFSIKGMTAKSWSEEHTVVRLPRESDLAIGDYVLITPRHVCPTVNLWESVVIVNKDGVIENEASPVDARNR